MKGNNKYDIAAGKLLVAEPFMYDRNFKRSVVLLCEHLEEGSIGFMLNKSVKMNITELLADFPDFKAEVYYGGPVQTDTIHFVHNQGDLIENSQDIGNGIYWGGDFERLKSLIELEMISPNDVRFFVGYSGWDSEQLLFEMDNGSWFVSEAKENYVFNTDYNNLWSNVLQEKGDTYSVIGQIPMVTWN